MPAAVVGKRSRWQVALAVLAWASLPLALAAHLILLQADSHWLGTLLAFGPRWVLLLPIAGAMAAASFRFKVSGFKLLAPLGLAAAVIAGPVMGFCVPWRTWVRSQGSGVRSQEIGDKENPHPSPLPEGEGKEARVKVLSCNTLGGRAEEGLKTLIVKEQPGVVVLQEWPSQRGVEGLLGEGVEVSSSKFQVSSWADNPHPGPLPEGEGTSRQWYVARAGGILVASRWPILDSEPLVSPARNYHVIGLRCELEIEGKAVQFFGLHLLTPRDGLEAVLKSGFGGLSELAEVTAEREADGMAVEAWMDGQSGQGIGARGQWSGVRSQESGVRRLPTIVAGDFNMPVESVIYRRRFGHLQNAFSTAGWGYGGTKYTRHHSVRIDHVLADKNWRIGRCEVGPNVGSDHRPVVAELVWLSFP